MAYVYLFLMVNRSTCEVVSAQLLSDGNPTIDQSRFFPIRYTYWEGKTHQEAYDKGVEWLRDPKCSLPECLVKMALSRV